MRRLFAVAGALLISAPLFARAETYGTTYSTQENKDRTVAIEPNVGIGGYTGAIRSDVVGTGPAYGATATFAPDRALSYELGYVGHSNQIEGTSSRLASNKVQAALKLGPNLHTGMNWRPYAFGGIGADFIQAGPSPQGLASATQGVIPLGVGADFFANSPVRVGARAQYDLTPGIGGAVSGADPHPDGWQATVNASAVF